LRFPLCDRVRLRSVVVSLFACATMVFFLTSAIGFAQSNQTSATSPRVEFQFEVDGKSWEPATELLVEIRSREPEDMSHTLIHLLYQRANLSHIAVEKVETEQGFLFKVNARRLPRIGEVAFRGLTAVQTQQARSNMRLRVGAPFISEESERDRESIRLKMVERGYLKATVGKPEVTTNLSNELKIVFPVSLDRPCRVAEVRVEPDEGLFDYFSTPIELGSLCDRAVINEILDRQKARLLVDGYLSSELSLNQIIYSPNKETAVVKIRYERGPKTRIEVVNRQTGAVSDVLSEFRENISAYDVLSLSEEELKGEVRKIFMRLGYASAVVTGPTRVTDPNGDSVVRFYLQSGPLVVISETQFIGELPISRQDALERLELQPGIFQGAVPFVEDSLPRYKERFIALLLEEGHADAKVSDPAVIYSPDGRSVKLILESSLGPRSILRDLNIVGKPTGFNFSQVFAEKVIQPGQAVNAGQLKVIEDEAQLELMNAGYAYASTRVDSKSLSVAADVKTIQVNLSIDSGPLVRIGNIFADGDVFGKQERIVTESGLQTGDLFTPENLEAARLRLLRHDLFESIVIEPLSSESLERRNSVLDIVIRTQAKKSYTLGLSPSYGTRNGYRFSVDYAKNNLTKDGLRFTSTFSVSQEKLQSSVLSNQRILGRKLTLGLAEPMLRIGSVVFPFDWNLLTGVEVSAQSLADRYFETSETGISWRPTVFKRTWAFQFRLAHEWSKALGSSLQPLEALERPTIKIREFVLGLSIDTRNNVEWPTRGWTVDLTSSHARFGLSSDVQYDRYTSDLGYFFPIWRRLSGAINAGGVRVSDVVNDQQKALTAPGSRRATLAGRSLVRGFPEASSAVTPGPLLWLNFQPPQQNPSLECEPTLRPIGATNVLYAKGELRVRSPWLANNLGFAAFLDSGAAFFTGAELNALQASLIERDTVLDPGSQDVCALKSAKVIGDPPVNVEGLSFFKQYAQNAYISTGLGVRYIISTFASLNFDIGFPLAEPSENIKGAQCVDPSAVNAFQQAPSCVRRYSSSRLFGVFPLPGAYHIGIGANF
jgi:outer membrane protein insertion porin family